MRTFINIFLFYFLLISFSIQAFPIPKNNKITYEIIRKNKVIGLHEIFFNQENGNLNIETKIEVEVKAFFLTVYKFSHNSKEIWKDGKFLKIDGFTDFEDEREYFIKAEVKDSFVLASGMDGDLKLDKNIIPSNFWNKDVMYQDEIFDTQKGIVRKLEVKEVGTETVMFNNKKIDCVKFILNASKNPKDKSNFPEYTLWYSKNKELMKFKFRSTKDNKIIEVLRKE